MGVCNLLKAKVARAPRAAILHSVPPPIPLTQRSMEYCTPPSWPEVMVSARFEILPPARVQSYDDLRGQ
jgi:hypothetical protein